MPRRSHGLLLLTGIALAGPAAAQLPYEPLIVAFDARTATPDSRPAAPDFRMPRGDLRDAPGPRRNGLIAALPLSDNVTLGVGRFRAIEGPRPRAHIEPAHRATEVRRRERGMAAVGLSLRF